MKPVLQALLLADKVYQDVTGKKIIAGTFNGILVGKMRTVKQELPDGSKRQLIPGGTDIGCPYVYISLTDVVDKTEIALQFVSASKNKVIFQTAFMIQSKDRLATIEIISPLPPVRQFIQEVGTFSFDVVWEGEILGSHRLVVRELAKPE